MKAMYTATILIVTSTLAVDLSTNSPRAYGQDRSIAHEIAVQRACEAAIWAMPAVSVYDIELSIQRDLGGKFGDIAYFTKPMTSRHGFLTANDVTPYVISGLSCQGDPLVVECLQRGQRSVSSARLSMLGRLRSPMSALPEPTRARAASICSSLRTIRAMCLPQATSSTARRPMACISPSGPWRKTEEPTRTNPSMRKP